MPMIYSCGSRRLPSKRPSTAVPGQHFSRLWLWKATVGALTLAVLALGTHDLFRAPRKLPKASFSISAPDKSTFSSIGRDAGPAAVSPDGSTIAFAAVVADGRKLLFVRELDSLTAQPLSGSEGASYPRRAGRPCKCTKLTRFLFCISRTIARCNAISWRRMSLSVRPMCGLRPRRLEAAEEIQVCRVQREPAQKWSVLAWLCSNASASLTLRASSRNTSLVLTAGKMP